MCIFKPRPCWKTHTHTHTNGGLVSNGEAESRVTGSRLQGFMEEISTWTCAVSEYTKRVFQSRVAKPSSDWLQQKEFSWVHTGENSRGRSLLSMIKSREDSFLKEKQGFGYQKIDEWILGSQHVHNSKYSRNSLE